MGCSVLHLHRVGDGCPDLLIGVNGHNVLAEIKDGKKPPSKRKLTPDQVRFFETWKGQKQVVKSKEEAIELVQRYRNL